MGKDPAFLWYPNDWNGGTAGWTFEEKGAYMELLMMQFNRGHMTTRMIAHTVGQLWDTLQVKFKQDENGLWYNVRLELEQERRRNFVNSRRNNISGENQHTKSRSHDHAYDKTYEPEMTGHMVNENVNENIDNVTLKKEASKILFDEFWKAYPKKRSKGEAEKAWKALKPNKELVAKMLEKLAQAKTCHDWLKDGGQFIPYPASWIRAEGWKDEYGAEAQPAQIDIQIPSDYQLPSGFKHVDFTREEYQSVRNS